MRIEQGKNIGRSNETTAGQQARSEAQAKWTKQLDKGYSEERGGSSKSNKPMLAHVYEDHKDKIVFPCYVQPKLDGQRCIAKREDGGVTLTSRGGKPITTMGHVQRDLLQVMKPGDVWDGELYHHEYTFEEIRSAVQKLQPRSLEIKYCIYDVVNEELTFAERYCPPLANTLACVSTLAYVSSLEDVSTYRVDSHENIAKYHEKFVEAGYEGLMVRHGGCHYRPDARSNQLLKLKHFLDGEFEIVDVIPGERSPTHGIFVCAHNGRRFNATPECPHAMKEHYLALRDKLIGKMLTVRYFEMTTTENPVPRFPIAVAVREEE